MRTTPAKKALKQVARGFMFLDEHGPRNWRRAVNENVLNMANCTRCVLGQLYLEFGVGMSILRLQDRDATRYGFDVTATWASGRCNVQVPYPDLENAVCRLLRHKPNLPQTGPPWRAGSF